MIIVSLQSHFMYLPTFRRNNKHNNQDFNTLKKIHIQQIIRIYKYNSITSHLFLYMEFQQIKKSIIKSYEKIIQYY